MFKRVGREIKAWAKALVILGMIPVVVGSGVGAFLMIDEMDMPPVVSILAAIICILLGYFLLRLCNMMLYSWGEVVDRVTRIDEKLEKLMERPVPAAPAAPAYSYAPPAAPAAPPVKAAPAAPVAPPVKAAPAAPAVPTVAAAPAKPVPVPVVSAPVKSAPAAPAANDPILEEDYTVAAVPRPVPQQNVVSGPKPVYSNPVRPVPANWTCPACGQVNNADGNWCRNCGTKKSV